MPMLLGSVEGGGIEPTAGVGVGENNAFKKQTRRIDA